MFRKLSLAAVLLAATWWLSSALVAQDPLNGNAWSRAFVSTTIYNTADQITNVERLVTKYASNIALLAAETAGTSTGRTLRMISQGDNGSTFSAMDLLRAGPFMTMGLVATETGSIDGTQASGAGNSLWKFGLFTSTATSGTVNPIYIGPTYNQAAASTINKDLVINRTETSVGSGAQLFADFQVATVSKYSVDHSGAYGHRASTFSACPAAPFEGELCSITDSTTATWGATITGSGTNHVLGYYDGTNWTVAGK
jgi:hypothetical protein